MGRAYLDTSLLVKRYLPERGSDELESFLLAEQPEVVVSEIARIELLSTVSRKHRDGELAADVVPHIQHASDEDYSFLSAAIGSTCIALRAGM